MEPEDALPFSLKLAVCPYFELDETGQQPYTQFLLRSFVILFSNLCLGLFTVSGFRTKILYEFLISSDVSIVCTRYKILLG
jgi:hypothetical protein